MTQTLDTAADGVIGADTETSAIKWYQGKVVGHCFSAYKDGKYLGFYVPVRHTEGNIEDVGAVEDYLNTRIYSNPKLKKVFFNVKFDLNMLLNHGIELQNVEDAMILMFLRNENERNHQLKSLATSYINRTAGDRQKEVVAYFKQNKLDNYGQIPVGILGPYGGEDASYTLALWRKFSRQFLESRSDSIERDGVRLDIYRHEMKFTLLAAKMERQGVPFDKDLCAELITPVEKAATELENHIWDLVFDMNEEIQPCKLTSDVQLGKLLADLGFEPITYSKRTGKPEWGKAQLMRLENELGQCIAAYRNLMHNISTFSGGLPKWEHRGRIHCSYNQIGARTGRASASEPNMQGIPTRVPRYTKVPADTNTALRMAFGIRKSFRAPTGYKVLKIDQSQFELRLLSHFAQDDRMQRAFQAGRDIHSDVACQLFDSKYDEFVQAYRDNDPTAKQYRAASKETNFAVVYGAGPKRLRETLYAYGHRFDLKEVRSFYYRYFEVFPGVRQFIDRVQAAVRKRGYIFNYYGRHKRVPASKAYVGVNYLIQGVTADMLKESMTQIDENVIPPGSPTQVMLAVHDEVDFLIHDDEHHLIPLFIDVMQDFPWCKTPILAEAEIGPSWGELERWQKNS